MKISKDNPTTVEETEEIVTKKVKVKKITHWEGYGIKTSSMVSLGTYFNSCTDQEWNEKDLWLMNRLYFSMKSDGRS